MARVAPSYGDGREFESLYSNPRVCSLTVECETFNFGDAGSSPAIPIYEFLRNYTGSLLYIAGAVWYNRMHTKMENIKKSLHLSLVYGF